MSTGDLVQMFEVLSLDRADEDTVPIAESDESRSGQIYFRKGNYFGMACFANMPVESELERGARMKSVGILSPSYTLLYRYMHFLENQV
eukprot:g42884.t1